MAAPFSYRTAGTVTAEGAKSGDLASALSKKRDKMAAEFEARKQVVEKRGADALAVLSGAFDEEIEGTAAKQDGTVYGVETKEMRAARILAADKARTEGPAPTDGGADPGGGLRDEQGAASTTEAPKPPVAAVRKRPRPKVAISFDEDEDGDEDGCSGVVVGAGRRAGAAASASASDTAKRGRLGKDPTAATWFLSDAQREKELAAARAEAERAWEASQDRVKKDKMEVTYSYWDGSGHRRRITVPKGVTVGKFLEWVRQDLVRDFPEMRGSASSDLLFVKEDLILPHATTFYELITSRARGKSGPLFTFGASEEVRVTDDATVEREDSHPGKIVQRQWFEKHKHVFPASRWEVFDPSVHRDKYTVRS